MTCSNCGKKVFAKETCQCGVKAPNSHGFGVGLSSVIFFIIVLISVICLIATLSLRTVVKKELIQKKIEKRFFDFILSGLFGLTGWKKLDYSQMYTLIHVLTYYNYKKRGV